MVQVMAKTSHKKPETSDWTKLLPPARLEQAAEHHLSNRESMSPVVIGHFLPVVLLHSQDPATQCVVIQVKLGNKAKIMEHP